MITRCSICGCLAETTRQLGCDVCRDCADDYVTDDERRQTDDGDGLLLVRVDVALREQQRQDWESLPW